MKIRKPIARRSPKMVKLMAQYNKQRKAFLELNCWCPLCSELEQTIAFATEIHHRRGRGRYLLDESTWTPVCRTCHTFIHNNVAWAYQNGWLELRNQSNMP